MRPAIRSGRALRKDARFVPGWCDLASDADAPVRARNHDMRPIRLFLLVLFASGMPLFAQTGAGPNDQALFLAGLPVRDSALDAYSHDPQWAEHAIEMDKAWGKTERRQHQCKA